jgi:WhiB family redox-sensing transcriptional regulator
MHTIVTYRLPERENAHNPRRSVRRAAGEHWSEQVTIPASSLTLANADYTWRRDAICRDTDPDLFFPVGTTGYALVQIDRAKQVCGECPVQHDCLEYALETNQDSGIWGGTSEEERRNLRRRLAGRERILV